MESKESKAIARYIRIAPLKVRIVMNNIRGKNVDEALTILRYTPKAASPIIAKVVKSAVANAENNYDMDSSRLYIAAAFVDQGPTMKRAQPHQRGRAFPILKRSSHITIVVKERA
ncbi:MAG: 50S ribosomal protein L22 [Negativicutes bacterium]|nr:50S ribosomal protein L22 [Negativicutes bacterium]